MNAKTFVLVMGWLLPIALMAQSTPPLIGYWKDLAHLEKQIQMYRQPDGKIGGRAMTNGSDTQSNRIVFRDLVWNDQKKSYEGILINPDNGSEFTIRIRMQGQNQFEFDVKRFFLSRTFRFQRVSME